MRVHNPKLRNISHTKISLWMFSLFSKDETFILYLPLLQLVLCRLAALKIIRTSSRVQIIFYLGPLRSVKIVRVFKTLTFRNIHVLLSNF